MDGAHLDAIDNVCGRYEGERPGLPCLTTRLITAISCVASLNKRGDVGSKVHPFRWMSG
jgi:allantoate deiminase